MCGALQNVRPESSEASRSSLEGWISRLERCVDYALQTADVSPEAVDRAAVALRATALPAIGAIIQLVAEPSPGGLLELPHDEIETVAQRVLESLRAVLAILEEEATPRPREPTDESSSDADARTAPHEAEALEAMKRALQALAKGDLSSAQHRQRMAAEALARAARAAAERLSKDRRRGESDSDVTGDPESEASGSEPGDPSRGGSPEAGSPIPSEADDSLKGSLVEQLLDGEGADDLWARLPSRLKRELLHSHREGVPERYRERVEAYFRALAEASGH